MCVDPAVRPRHPAMVKAEEVHSLASLLEVHDPRLGRFEFESHLGQDRRECHQGILGFPLGLAQRQQIIRIAQQQPVPACLPFPVKPVQVDVAQDGRNHTALRGAAHTMPDRARLKHPSAQHRAQELQQVAIADPLLNRRHQP